MSYLRKTRIALTFLLLTPVPLLSAQTERDVDALPKRALTADEVRRRMPVDPRALTYGDNEMRELARAVAAGSTDARILRAYWRLHLRHYPFTDPVIDPRPRAFAARAALATGGDGVAAASCWTPLGPTNLPGRMTAVALHPGDANTVYAGGADGGVWRTTDLGATWTALSDFEATLAIGAMAIDPTNPNVVYAGTGEGNYAGDNLAGVGVLKTTDAGASWTLYPRFASHFHELLVDRAAASRLWAATRDGLFRSDDGAQTWSRVGSGLPAEDVTSVWQSPADPDLLLAGVGGGFGTSAARGLYRTTDAGSNWTPVASIPSGGDNGRLKIAGSESNPMSVYVALASTSTGGVKGIYRSVDGGAIFTQVGQPASTCSTYCWYCLTIAVDPVTPDLVYVGGVSIYRSSDGGANWARINSVGPNTYVHVDQHQFLTPAADHFWSANDGGINRSTDRGASFQFVGLTLETAQYYHFTTDPTDDTYAIGGTQDNGTHKFSGSTLFSTILGGDGAYTAIDWVDPRVYYASSQFLNMARSRDRGAAMRAIGAGIDGADPTAFIAPFALDRGDPGAMFAGTNRLWHSTDQGDSFVAFSPQLGNGRVVTAIDNCRDAPTAIWFGGSGDGYVFHSSDGGANWLDRSAGLPNRAVTSLAAHPADPATAYVSLGGSGTGHVFKKTDAGATWRDVSGTLPDIHTNRVLVLDDRPETVVVAADLGIYQSDDGGANWYVLGTDLPNVAVDWLTYSPITGTLRAATHGRGAFQLVTTGACPLTPSFAGIGAIAVEPASCGPRLSWSVGTPNCAAFPTLSYAVYRSGRPDFIPDAASLIAAGLATTSYLDTTANGDTPYYYLVRAEDGQTGQGGPANGGRTDGNLRTARIQLGVAAKTPVFSVDADPDIWLGGDAWSISASANSTPGGSYSYHSAPGGSGSHLADVCDAVTTPDLDILPLATLSYSASYNLEEDYDGVVVEISTDGGMNWADLPPAGGYPGSFALTQNPPINACVFPASRRAFSGPPGNAAPTAFAVYTSDLAAFAGTRARIRWVLSSDPGSEFEGFFLDDVVVEPVAPVVSPPALGNVVRGVRVGGGARFEWSDDVPSASAYRLVHAGTPDFSVAETVGLGLRPNPRVTDSVARSGAIHYYRVHALFDCANQGP